MAYLVPSEFVTKMVDAGESKIFMKFGTVSATRRECPFSVNLASTTPSASPMAETSMGRFGQVEEIASLVSWLCTEDCSFSTGAVFDLSGGRAVY